MTRSASRALVVLVLALGALGFAASSSAHERHGHHWQGRGDAFHYTTTVTSTDSGTCGQASWANDTLERTYVVHRSENGVYTLTVFDHGSFTTLAAASPGACETSTEHGHLVTAGITGRVLGFLHERITGGTFDANATCTGCSRASFVAAFFGAGAKQSCDADQTCRYAYLYFSRDAALEYHHWLDAGRAGATGGLHTVDRGDVATS